MSVPTEGEEFAKLIEHLRLAQESTAKISHLVRANDDHVRANMWLAVTELLRRTQLNVTKLATAKMH